MVDNMEPKSKAKSLLQNMNKNFSDSSYTDMPMETEGSEEQKFRAREGNETINPKERVAINNIQLTRAILSIDNDNYDVDDKMANELSSYIERSPETALTDLKMEYGFKIKEFYSKIQDTKNISPKEFHSEPDFLRAQHHEKKKLEEFENRLEYISLVIKLLETHQTINFEEEERQKKRLALDEFDFSFINTHGNNGYQHLG